MNRKLTKFELKILSIKAVTWSYGKEILNGFIALGNGNGEESPTRYLPYELFMNRMVNIIELKHTLSPEEAGIIPEKIKVEVRGGIAYCDDERVEIIDHDNLEDYPHNIETTPEFKLLQEKISEWFNIPIKDITPFATISNLDLDSLDFVDLIMKVEEEYGIHIPDEIAEKLETVESFYQEIIKHSDN